jgi:hypothetical protein
LKSHAAISSTTGLLLVSDGRRRRRDRDDDDLSLKLADVHLDSSGRDDFQFTNSI